MEDGTGSLGQTFHHPPGDDHRRQGNVTARHSLPENHDIGYSSVRLQRGPGAGASRAGQDFIGDPEDLIAIANFANSLPVAAGWNRSSGSGAPNRFSNQRRDTFRTLLHDGRLECLTTARGTERLMT